MSAYERQQKMEQLRKALPPSFLKVGDKVRLNDTGLEQCFHTRVGLAAVKQVVHTITYVESESMTYPEPSYPVEVADPELNMLMLDDYCFDKVNDATA